MYPYESSPFTNVNPTQSNPFQNLGSGFQGSAFQTPQSHNYPPQNFQPNVSRFGVSSNVPPYQSAFAFQTPLPYQGFSGAGYPGSQFGGSQFQSSPYQNTPPGMEYGGRGQFLSPEEFAGNLGAGRFAESRLTTLLFDPIFIAELSRSGRGLQDVAEQLEGIQTQSPGQALRDETHRKAIYAATAHLFYTFGLLASKGIFITGDLPGKLRSEVGGPANACREFGRQLERFVEKAASGRGVTEELSRLVERGTACYAEITRAIEGSETSDQTARKKVAA
jgi:hypothetical protein